MLERCKSSAPAALADTARQWFCTRAVKVVTYADRELAVLGYDRNDTFLTTVSETLEIAETTPGSATTKSNCQLHAARQISEWFDAALTRYRTFLGASSFEQHEVVLGTEMGGISGLAYHAQSDEWYA